MHMDAVGDCIDSLVHERLELVGQSATAEVEEATVGAHLLVRLRRMQRNRQHLSDLGMQVCMGPHDRTKEEG